MCQVFLCKRVGPTIRPSVGNKTHKGQYIQAVEYSPDTKRPHGSSSCANREVSQLLKGKRRSAFRILPSVFVFKEEEWRVCKYLNIFTCICIKYTLYVDEMHMHICICMKYVQCMCT